MRAALRAADVVATTSQWENRWVAGHFRLPAAMRRAMRISPLGIDAALYGRTFSEGELAAFRAQYACRQAMWCRSRGSKTRRTSSP